jgi:trk system potassium uptake protein TrkA
VKHDEANEWGITMNVVIIGGGEVGTYLASLLSQGNHHVTIIEQCADEVRRIQQGTTAQTVICGSGTDPAVLERAGIRQAMVLAAVTGADETNLVATSLARFEFHVPRTIARVHTPTHAWMFTNVMGVDVAVNQADLMAHLIAEEMSFGDMMTLLKLRKGQYSLVEEKVHPAARAVGQPLRDLPVPPESVLAAIIRGGRLLLPQGDVVVQSGDEVLAVAHATALPKLAALLGRPE